jgi:hypothetical protein
LRRDAASAPENLKKLRGRPRTTPWERENHPKPHPAALTTEEKEMIAFYAMERGAGQFHYGKHAISDETGAYQSYPAEVNRILNELYDASISGRSSARNAATARASSRLTIRTGRFMTCSISSRSASRSRSRSA